MTASNPSLTWSAVSSNQDVVTLTSSSGTGNGTIQYTVKPNPLATTRTATITVTPGQGGAAMTVTVTLAGGTLDHFSCFGECRRHRRIGQYYPDHERSRSEMDRERRSELGDDHQRRPGNRAGADSMDRGGEHDATRAAPRPYPLRPPAAPPSRPLITQAPGVDHGNNHPDSGQRECASFGLERDDPGHVDEPGADLDGRVERFVADDYSWRDGNRQRHFPIQRDG